MKRKLVLMVLYALLEIAEYGRSFMLDCEKEGFTVVESENCASYYYCVKTANDEFYAVKYECPLGEEFSLLTQKCIPQGNNECGKLPETHLDDPILTNEFVCPSAGRFPDFESSDCKTYYMCSSELVPVLSNCPSTTLFSWVSMKCVMPTSFTCPNGIITTTELATTTTEENVDPEGFICETEGRFSDPQSVDCKSFYLCAKTVDGNIDATLFQCPSATVFSPEIQKCIEPSEYECPSTTSTTGATPTTNEETGQPNSFLCTNIGRFPNPTSTDCTTYYLCTISINGVYEAVLTECPLSTVFSPVDQECLESGYQCSAGTTEDTTWPSNVGSTTTDVEVTTPSSSIIETTVTDIENGYTKTTTEHIDATTSHPAEFICTQYGRFPDPESTDCKSYFLCTENTEGFFDATPNRCPSNTIFNPETGKCVQPINYQCPMMETTTMTELTENPPTVVTTISSTVQPTITVPESSTAVYTTYSTTNEPSTSRTDKPTSNPPGESFVCSAFGRFPDPESTDCKRYYLCTEDTTGLFKATLNQCPSITIFHPDKAKCVQPTDYQCSTLETTTPEPTEQTSTIETTVPSSKPSTLTPEKHSTSVATTELPPPSELFVCPAVGRFPDPASADCKGFYLCSTTATGTYEAIHTQCPSITIFSAEQNRCVLMSQYQCPTPATTTADPSTQNTTISTSSTGSSTTTSSSGFVCTSVGRHPDATHPDCSKYKYCILTATNEFLEYTFSCPLGTSFNPQELRCSSDYSCPIRMPTFSPELTTSHTTTPFQCTTDGRFPDQASEGCNTYIMCLKTTVGGFQKYNFKCPSGSLFSPVEAKCSSSYLCN